MRYPEGVAYMDGQYLPMSEAKISVLDWGFLHSDATYDTVHVWNGRFFRPDLHLDRFLAGVEKLRMRLPFGRAEIIEVLLNCTALSRLRNAYVEMICTRGASPTFSRDPREAQNRFIAFAIPFSWVANEAQRRTGLNLAVSQITRIPPRSIDPAIKNYHWLDLVRGLYEGYERNADTAVVLDLNGNVAEGPGFNVFAVTADGVKTLLSACCRASRAAPCSTSAPSSASRRKPAISPLRNCAALTKSSSPQRRAASWLLPASTARRLRTETSGRSRRR